jgi:uncharacterized protein YcbX
MVVGEIWRYPVKSMGGEPLKETVLTFDGIPGARVALVATLVQDVSVLRKIVRERGGRLALDCRVIEPGRVAVGDPVEVL